MSESLKTRFRKLKNQSEAFQEELNALVEATEREVARVRAQVKALAEKLGVAELDEEQLQAFIEKPYYIYNKDPKSQSWYVIVPRIFKDFRLGWLETTTESYNVFVVDRFIQWLGDVPDEMASKFHFPEPLPFRVQNGFLLTDKDTQDTAWERYKKHLYRKEGSDRIKVKSGQEFHLIRSLINDGILPFIPRPVEKGDTRDPAQFCRVQLREYQVEQGLQPFKDNGAVGVFWAQGAGKTFLTLYICAMLKGSGNYAPNKLIVVPTRALKEQWERMFDEYTTISREVRVETYASFHKVKDSEWLLVVFDEAHHLPARTYARLSTLRTKYRLGLSATPIREDGHSDLIFALTGFPQGLDWQTLIEEGIIQKPYIDLYLVDRWHDKLRVLQQLLKIPMKTLIFCDGISKGKTIANRFSIPHVYGGTTQPVAAIRNGLDSVQSVVVSRVGDEGLDFPDIERTIEVDFLFGSRRQESQRVGRILHKQHEGRGHHIIIMTDREQQSYEKRFYSLYEKGFQIELHRA